MAVALRRGGQTKKPRKVLDASQFNHRDEANGCHPRKVARAGTTMMVLRDLDNSARPLPVQMDSFALGGEMYLLKAI